MQLRARAAAKAMARQAGALFFDILQQGKPRRLVAVWRWNRSDAKVQSDRVSRRRPRLKKLEIGPLARPSSRTGSELIGVNRTESE